MISSNFLSTCGTQKRSFARFLAAKKYDYSYGLRVSLRRTVDGNHFRKSKWTAGKKGAKNGLRKDKRARIFAVHPCLRDWLILASFFFFGARAFFEGFAVSERLLTRREVKLREKMAR